MSVFYSQGKKGERGFPGPKGPQGLQVRLFMFSFYLFFFAALHFNQAVRGKHCVVTVCGVLQGSILGTFIFGFSLYACPC